MANPSFQIDDEALEEFDRIIAQKRGAGDLPTSYSRSDVIRQLIMEYVEGNGTSRPKSVATSR